MAIHIVSGRVDRIEVRVPARTDSVGFAPMIVTAIAAFEDLDDEEEEEDDEKD